MKDQMKVSRKKSKMDSEPGVGYVRQRISAFENVGVNVSSKSISKPSFSNPLKNVRNIISKLESGFLGTGDQKKNVLSTLTAVTGSSSVVTKTTMPGLVRPSKFRHIYCSTSTTNSLSSNIGLPYSEKPLFAVSLRFCALAFGHRFLVFSRRASGETADAIGHAADGAFDGVKILDATWNPNLPEVLAFSGTGGSVQVWAAGSRDFLPPTLTRVSEVRHPKDVHLLRWHPKEKNILLCASSPDHVICIWNVETGSKLTKISGFHDDLIGGVAWSCDGSYIASACKRGIVRLFAFSGTSVPHGTNDGNTLLAVTEIHRFQAHSASKVFDLAILKDGRIFTSGLTILSMREIALWENPLKASSMEDSSNNKKESSRQPLFREIMDQGTGYCRPMYDPELGLVYLMAKGDPGFRVFEITDEKPFVHFLTRHVSTSNFFQSADFLAPLPASGLDGSVCEIQRLLRFDVAKKRLEQFSVRVPRRHPLAFRTEIYHQTPSQLQLFGSKNQEKILNCWS